MVPLLPCDRFEASLVPRFVQRQLLLIPEFNPITDILVVTARLWFFALESFQSHLPLFLPTCSDRSEMSLDFLITHLFRLHQAACRLVSVSNVFIPSFFASLKLLDVDFKSPHEVVVYFCASTPIPLFPSRDQAAPHRTPSFKLCFLLLLARFEEFEVASDCIRTRPTDHFEKSLLVKFFFDLFGCFTVTDFKFFRLVVFS